jgi:formylmethanofuran dehydrogenase subunit D
MNGLNNVELEKQLKSNNMKTTTVKEDPLTGDLYIELDEETWDLLRWQEGDTVVWEKYHNSWIVRKKDDTTVEQVE